MFDLFWPLIAYLFVGSLSGLLGGLLGIGGGTVIVPSLYYLFSYIDLPKHYVMQLAIGTSLASVVFSSFSSAKAHYKKGAVDLAIIQKMGFGLCLGCFLGGFIAHMLLGIFLQIAFGVFALCLSIYFYIKKTSIEAPFSPSKISAVVSSTLIATLSSILGIGGGVMLVPYLHAHRFSEKKSIGTSSALSLAISLCAAASYAMFGFSDFSYPLCLGYIYLPAFICLATSSYVAAPIGAHLAHRLPSPILKKIFSFFMFIVGILMIFKG